MSNIDATCCKQSSMAVKAQAAIVCYMLLQELTHRAAGHIQGTTRLTLHAVAGMTSATELEQPQGT
jgi:hypothetical protein